MNEWMAGKYVDLWNEYKLQIKTNNDNIQKKVKSQKFKKHVLKPGESGYDEQLLKRRIKASKFYARNGDLSGGIKAIESFGVLELNDKNWRLIEDLHPFEPELKIEEEEEKIENILRVETLDIEQVLNKVKKTTGARYYRLYYFTSILMI